MAAEAPETKKLISEITLILKSRGMTRENLHEIINSYLPFSRRIGNVQQLFRWLNTDSAQWSEPKAEIVLALLKFQTNYR